MSSSTDIKFPLNELISILQGEGFDISTRTILDIQKVIANLDEDDMQDTAHLKFLLGPLICRNKEEQEKFYQVFDMYEENVKAVVLGDTKVIIKENSEKKEKEVNEAPSVRGKNKNKRIFIIITSGVLLIASAYAIWHFFIKRNNSTPTAASPAIYVNQLVPYTTEDSIAYSEVYFGVPFEIIANRPATFKAALSDTVAGTKYHIRWQIIDDSTINSSGRSVSKVFAKPGIYKVRAFLEEKNTVVDQTDYSAKVLCENSPLVKIERDSSVKSKGKERIYRARFFNQKDKSNYSYSWTVTALSDSLSSNPFRSNAQVLRYAADPLSAYTVKLVLKGHSDPACAKDNSDDSTEFQLIEKPDFVLQADGTKPLQLNKRWNDTYLSRLLIFCLIFPVVIAYNIHKEKLQELKKKFFKKREIDDSGKQGKREFTGPYNISFRTQENKIAREIAISQLAETLRKRHSSDSYRLNIVKTIRNTIRKGGFPVFAFTPRTQPADFLVFIDKEYPDSHLSKLYTYVIDSLKKEQVNLTLYSYYREPLLLSNESLNHLLIPVDRIARLYPCTILFLFTDGNSFFRPLDIQLHDWVYDKFKGWDTKLIFTSVAKKDWGAREMMLYNAGFTVVPADINAHQLISDEINNMIDRQKLKKTVIPDAYSSRLINFNDWKQVKKYLANACKKNNSLLPGETDDYLLKEWLCATAVYPYVSWEITIAVGKAIEQKKCKPGELVNYSNLLILGRIQWLQDGQLTDTMRIEMLKELHPDHEIIAREAISGLLDEIGDTIPESSAVFGEFNLQKTTNRFLIRKYKEKNIGFDDKDYLAVKEYADKEQLDTPVEVYLNDPDSNSPLTSSGITKTSIPLNNYIENQEKEKMLYDEQQQQEFKQKKKQLLTKAVIYLAAIIGIATFSLSSVFNIMPREYPQAADRSISFLPGGFPGSRVNKISVNIDGKEYPAKSISADSFSLAGIPTKYTDAGITLVVNSPSSGEQTFTSVFESGFEGYQLSFTAPAALIPLSIKYNNETDFRGIEQQLKSTLDKYDITSLQNTNAADTVSRVTYYDNNQKTKADSLVRILSDNLGIALKTEYVDQPGTATTVFLYFSHEVADNCVLVNLPQSLTEIWKGGTSNRLLNINVASGMIYYSTGDKMTYGSYRINEVCRNNKGVYRVITAANKQYKVVFVKDVSATSFNFSVCQDTYETKEKAREVKEANCDRFNIMNLLYENNRNRVYLPVRAQQLVSSEVKKVKLLADSINDNTTRANIISITTAIYENGQYLMAADQNTLTRYLPDNGVRHDLKNGDRKKMAAPNPFDRSYMTVGIAITRIGDPGPCSNKIFTSIREALSVDPATVCNLDLSKQNLVAIPSELSRFVNLKSLDIRNNKLTDKDSVELFRSLRSVKIQFTPQIQNTVAQKWQIIREVSLGGKMIPDSRYDKLFDVIDDELRKNARAKIKVVAFYEMKSTDKDAQARIDGIRNYLRKYQWDRYIKEGRVIFETSDDVYKAERVSSMTFFQQRPVEVSVYGLNLSADFLNTAAKSMSTSLK